MERALLRLGVRFLEEELPEEAIVDGGLCKVGDETVLFISPIAPPWRRVKVLLDALRRLPHQDLWLPPEIRSQLRGGTEPPAVHTIASHPTKRTEIDP